MFIFVINMNVESKEAPSPFAYSAWLAPSHLSDEEYSRAQSKSAEYLSILSGDVYASVELRLVKEGMFSASWLSTHEAGIAAHLSALL